MFEKNSTVCFLGDSITAGGRWIYEVYSYFKNDRIKFFDCGRSGIAIPESTKSLYADCLSHTPDTVVIMFGMNDINTYLYLKDGNDDERKERLDAFKNNLDNMIDIIKDFGCEILLCTPTTYDDVSKCRIESEKTSENADGYDISQTIPIFEENRRCNCGLKIAADIVKELGKKHGLSVVDFHTPMTALLGKDIITNPDRTHPNPHGAHIMAQIFLKAIGKISETDFEGTFTFSPALSELFDIKEILRGISFTELLGDISKPLSNKLTVEARKEIVGKMYEKFEDKEQYIPQMYKIYTDTIDYKSEYEELYIKKMVEFWNEKD